MRHELTVPMSGNFYLDAGSAEEVLIILKECEDIKVVLDAAGPRFEEAANQATLEGFEEAERSFPRAGVGYQLIIPWVNDGVVARWCRRWSRRRDRTTITVTIPRDVRFTATTRFGNTASTRLLNVGLLPFVEAAEDRRVPLDPETVEGMIIRGGRVRCLDGSSLQEEL
ncbi:hypothetical protein BKA00_003929 [Actinomadura coerulea]|uniref:Uncharacterized protein n=1 Tax=Actinomadura coerulea TaxID=46159 RepID=A0A7X0G1K7_9ACTN|nr:hypothetical protein [Actinomadura coerulea]MBB6397015.1 hypothetical protein [Actinomadura coerulea]GGP96036.1 hypothetical protein GCM10010187_09580 [Actinomadura coerulea]